jgi:hypothetical protein
MQNYQEQNALPFPKDDFFSSEAEDPKQISRALKMRILCLVTDIEQLIENPDLADHLDFLDAIAAHIVTLNSLSCSTSICHASIIEAGKLIDNLLTCPVLVKNRDFSLSTLDAAKIYRKNRKNKEPLTSLLKSYSEQKETTLSLLNELKLLAFDLNEKTENI